MDGDDSRLHVCAGSIEIAVGHPTESLNHVHVSSVKGGADQRISHNIYQSPVLDLRPSIL